MSWIKRWRELRYTVLKIFTIIFILITIGILSYGEKSYSEKISLMVENALEKEKQMKEEKDVVVKSVPSTPKIESNREILLKEKLLIMNRYQ